MATKTGKIKISSENMMPIIKKWLYSDKDIFLREIVSNASDAITKLSELIKLGKAEAGEPFKITVTTDEENKTLTVEDNGIGMSEEEVERYITQIAFSGAADFLEKYEKAGGEGIIGHFGLGFYSAYMVSENIEIFTKSYEAGAKGVHWESDGESTYKIEECDKDTRGTKIVMHLAKEEGEFLKEFEVRRLLNKYCSFMPYHIYLNPKGTEEDKPVNNPSPLYLKQPKDCTEEEYKTFYRETFRDYNEPLFQIHLNMDYPFRLKGILYFPKVIKQVQLERGQVKLYCNQVFIADNIKEVIPEFLMLLNGVIDCPDIPLNVSRSFLQNDAQVKKIASHITKKVADKLFELYQNDRKKYEDCWKDLATFVKFGCMKDDKFYDRVKDIVIFKNLSGEFRPLESFFGAELSDEDAKAGKEAEPVYYVTDPDKQAQYVEMFKGAGIDAMICDSFIDGHFISFLEYKNPKRARFLRIDADLASALREEGEGDEETQKLFEEVLKDKKVKIKMERLKDDKVPAVINSSEFMRRMNEMSSYYHMEGSGEEELTLVVNLNCGAVKALKGGDEERRKISALQIYFLALLSYRRLNVGEMGEFYQNERQILEKYLEK